MELHHIVQSVFAAIVVGLHIYKRVTGVDLLKMLVMSKPVIISLTAVIEALYNVIPNETQRIIKTVLNASVEGTELAEKAWLLGNLEREERNPFAKEVAYDLLETVGIEITAQIEAIVAGIIEMTCMVLPHGVKPEEPKIEETV